jgi:hypothetical protein
VKNIYRFLAFIFLTCLNPIHAEPSADLEQKQRLTEQKLKLVEMMIEAPATKSRIATGDPEISALIETSRTLTQQAKLALSAKNYSQATQQLDEALRYVFKINSRASNSTANEENQKQKFHDFSQQIASYRAALLDMIKNSDNAEAAKKLLRRIDHLSDEARQLHNVGKLAESNNKMADAYKLAVTEISQLRAGQEVVMALKFATSADEFEYELKRYQSNEILVRMMVNEGRADGDRRKLIDEYLHDAGRLNEEAQISAKNNNYKNAVAVMEKSNGQLNRALQTMGIPVF